MSAAGPSFCVSSVTGTHAMYLARYLASESLLRTYFTTLPASRTPGIPAASTRRHLALLLAIYATQKSWIPGDRGRMYARIDGEFDRWMAARLERSDVVHALPGCGLRTRRRAKARFGALTVCDPGTSHVRLQQRILQDESRRWGTSRRAAAERDLANVETEYDEADLITVPSTFARDGFVSMGLAPGKIAVTPYGADLDEYRPQQKDDDIFRILCVGTICLRKGIPYLLEAAARLRMPRAELAFRGALEPEMAEMIAGYRGDIPMKLVPPQPRSAMSHLFSQASVVVLPSVEDGFGLVIPQAMACGVPVIASRNTGGPDVIADGVNGFLVPARDANALQGALTRAYEDPESLKAMGIAARATLERAGGWRAYGDAMVRACVAARGRQSKTGNGA